MAKYKETQVTVTDWKTLGKIKFVFLPSGSVKVTMVEETVRKTGNDSSVVSTGREFQVSLDNKSTTFLLYDPDIGLPTGGDSTYRQLEKLLFSLYYTEALKADAEEINNAQ